MPESCKLVEWDGVIALFIGGSFTCYLAIKEIIKLPSSISLVPHAPTCEIMVNALYEVVL
jgi:hypothetical protein